MEKGLRIKKARTRLGFCFHCLCTEKERNDVFRDLNEDEMIN